MLLQWLTFFHHRFFDYAMRLNIADSGKATDRSLFPQNLGMETNEVLRHIQTPLVQDVSHQSTSMICNYSERIILISDLSPLLRALTPRRKISTH